MATRSGVVFFWATLLLGIALGQTEPDDRAKPVRITGRLIHPDGTPVSFGMRMARISTGGPKDEATVMTGPDGIFVFIAAPAKTYRISIGVGMMKTPPKIVNTTGASDIDVGDMIFEDCPPTSTTVNIPKPPTTRYLVGELTPEQIIIEPQRGVNPHYFFLGLLPTSTSNNAVDVPPCWSGFSLGKELVEISLDRYVTIESFVGGKVKFIRVIRYDSALTPLQIRDEVRKVWLGLFRSAAPNMRWSEGTLWNIQASVEHEDGKRTSISTDGWHVQVEDREGKYWFIRMRPAVQ